MIDRELVVNWLLGHLADCEFHPSSVAELPCVASLGLGHRRRDYFDWILKEKSNGCNGISGVEKV